MNSTGERETEFIQPNERHGADKMNTRYLGNSGSSSVQQYGRDTHHFQQSVDTFPRSHYHDAHGDDRRYRSSTSPVPPPDATSSKYYIPLQIGSPDHEREDEPFHDANTSNEVRGRTRLHTKVLTAVKIPSNEVMSSHSSYQGNITGSEAEQLLRSMDESCYLTRFSKNNKKYALSYMISTVDGDFEVRHCELVIDNDDSCYELKGTRKVFTSISKLLSFYERNPLDETTRTIGIPYDGRTRSEEGGGGARKVTRDRHSVTKQWRPKWKEEEEEHGSELNASSREFHLIRQLIEDNKTSQREMREEQWTHREKMDRERNEEQKLYREQMEKMLEIVATKGKREKKSKCSVM